MNHILVVHVFHRLHNLFENGLDLVLIVHPGAGHFSDVLVKVVAVDVLDHDGHFVARVDGVVELHDARMIQAAQDVDLLLQGLYARGVLEQFGLFVLLESDLDVRSPLDSSLHDTEGSLPDQDLDVVILERRQIRTVQAHAGDVSEGGTPVLGLVLLVPPVGVLGLLPLLGTVVVDSLVVAHVITFSLANHLPTGNEWRFQKEFLALFLFVEFYGYSPRVRFLVVFLDVEVGVVFYFTFGYLP